MSASRISLRIGDLDARQREQLRRKARLAGKSDSELVREILKRELSTAGLGARTRHLAGTLSLKRRPEGSWRKEIRSRSWRPESLVVGYRTLGRLSGCE